MYDWVRSKSRKALFTYQSGERGGGGMLYILGIIWSVLQKTLASDLQFNSWLSRNKKYSTAACVI